MMDFNSTSSISGQITALIDAGIKTTYVNYPGTIHGFFSLTRFLGQGLKANDEAAAVMGAHFGM